VTALSHINELHRAGSFRRNE